MYTNNRKNAIGLELLGVGSSKHRAFRTNLDEALRALSLQVPVTEIEDIDELLRYGIAAIPALLYNGNVLFQEEVPSVEDLKNVLAALLSEPPVAFPLRRILVSTDFSDTACNAYAFARHLARRFDAPLRLVHVHQPHPELVNPYQEDLTGYAEKEKQLADFVLPHDAGTEVKEERFILTGSPVEELCRYARRTDCDLIVMGTTGTGGLLGRWFGSISSEVARRAACPVLLTPPQFDGRPFRNIVFASTLSASEAGAAARAVAFARHFGASVHFAHILPPRKHDRTGPVATYEQAVSGAEVPVSLTTIEHEDVLEGLNDYATGRSADLMIMATTQRGILADLLHRSLTRRMVFNSRIPLLVLHF